MQPVSDGARGAVQQRHHGVRRLLRRPQPGAGRAAGEDSFAADARQRRHCGRHGDEDHAAQFQRAPECPDQRAARRAVRAVSGFPAGRPDGCQRLSGRQRQDHAAREDRHRRPQADHPGDSGHDHDRKPDRFDREGGRKEQNQNRQRQRLHDAACRDRDRADPRLRSGENAAGALHVHGLFGVDLGQPDRHLRKPPGRS